MKVNDDENLRRSERRKPKVNYNENKSVYEIIFRAETLAHDVPLTFHKAFNGPNREKWIAAIKEELKSLEMNNTWSFVERPKDSKTNIVSCKWVFNIKTDGSGNPIR